MAKCLLQTLFLGLTFFVSEIALAKLVLPTGLGVQDRDITLSLLGEETAPKILGNPFTMGGYSGVEVGMSIEAIPTGDIAHLGSRANEQDQTTYQVFTLGKGIYKDVDLYLQFGLLENDESLSNFGGQVRWTFFQAEYLPIFTTAVLSANSANFQNLLTTNTQEGDVILGVTIEDVTLFLGAGFIRSQGVFSGTITDSSFDAKENVSGGHYVAGLNVRISEFFLAAEIDRYTESTYSGKVGIRF